MIEMLPLVIVSESVLQCGALLGAATADATSAMGEAADTGTTTPRARQRRRRQPDAPQPRGGFHVEDRIAVAHCRMTVVVRDS